MMKYPIGIQNFEKLRSEGYVYVDKTPQMWEDDIRGQLLLPLPSASFWQVVDGQHAGSVLFWETRAV